MKHLPTSLRWMTTLAVVSAMTLTVTATPAAHAESMFRAGIAYQTAQPYTPKSLFASPRAATIGDMITININENTAVNLQNTSTIEKKQDLTENSTNILNQIFNKLGIKGQLLPTVNGLNNDHEIDVTGRAQKQYAYTDAVACQVVEVLPNGYLHVQGKKQLNANQEQQTLYVNGIENPYYLDATNAISSNQVSNLEMNVAERGQVARQQGDGIIGKYFQVLN